MFKNEFVKESPLTTSCAKVIEWQPGKVQFSRYEYINKIVEELRPNMEGSSQKSMPFTGCWTALGQFYPWSSCTTCQNLRAFHSNLGHDKVMDSGVASLTGGPKIRLWVTKFSKGVKDGHTFLCTKKDTTSLIISIRRWDAMDFLMRMLTGPLGWLWEGWM